MILYLVNRLGLILVPCLLFNCRMVRDSLDSPQSNEKKPDTQALVHGELRHRFCMKDIHSPCYGSPASLKVLVRSYKNGCSRLAVRLGPGFDTFAVTF